VLKDLHTIEHSMPIALLIRGHERGAFKNKRLYDFLKKFTSVFDVHIYIHTWNVSAGDVSWKPRNFEKYPITEEIVRTYLDDIVPKDILIDNENTIELHGSLHGNVAGGPCPAIAWKRMWYGKYRLIEHVNAVPDTYDFVVNTRFDIFENVNNIFTEDDIIRRTQQLYDLVHVFNKKVNTIYFMNEEPCPGIDNIYFGNKKLLYLLSKDFNENLDEIAARYPTNFYTEYIVFFQALLYNYNAWNTLLKHSYEVTRIKME